MSQTAADLLDGFSRIDPAERPAVVEALLSVYLIGRWDRPVPVPGLGILVPLPPIGGTPPDLTPEEEAEIADRLADLDDSLPLEDFIASLADPAPAPAGSERR